MAMFGLRALIFGLSVLIVPLSAAAESMFLDISISYRERIALPPDAVVDVELLDTSKMDVAAERLSSQRFQMTSVPFDVELAYDPALIREGLTYTVAARILSEGRVVFRTTQAFPVLTRGSDESADLVLEMMPAPENAGRIDGVTWEAFEVSGRLLVVDKPPSLQIDANGRFGLFSGCNTFTGRVDLEAQTISFPQNFAGTLMACPPAADRLQRSVLDAIGQTSEYQITESGLVFTNSAGVPTLRFRRAPE